MSLMVEVDRFLRRTGMPRTKLGRLACNDPRLVDDMRRGRQLGPYNVTRLRDTMARLQR